MILTLFFTVAFCLGLTIITQEGQLLYFVRKPFVDLDIMIENFQALKLSKCKIFFLKLKYFIGKPLIGCITCMASVWGAAIFLSLNDFDLVKLIINCISASFIQTFIWELYKKI